MCPTLKDDKLIGTITIFRQEVRPLHPTSRSRWSRILPKQAVIAIENTRLLRELRERTNDLQEITCSSRPLQPTCSR